MQSDSSLSPDNLPRALRPVYTTNELNQPIVLYEGPLTLTQGETVEQGNGNVKFVWFPYSSIKFEFSNNNPAYRVYPGDASLNLLEIATSVKVHVSRARSGGRGNQASGQIKEPIIQGAGRDLVYVLFHVTNFHNFVGSCKSILFQDSRKTVLDRVTFEVESWKLTLETLETTKGDVDSLNSLAGFAVTHIGKLEQLDGQAFSGDEARDFLEIFSNFLSFARGFRVPVFLFVGYDTHGNKTWQYWAGTRGNSWQGVNSWFPEPYAGRLIEVFPGFIRWWRDWKESAELTLHWYLESNICAGAVEGSIILEQTALELIAWVLFVEKEQIYSQDKFDKFNASQKLRKMLKKFGIPLSVPPSLNNLVQFASDCQWQDGPHALTEIRNGIVHPKKRQKILEADLSRNETWKLGLWYLELALLGIFNYHGRYTNRTLRKFPGDTEPVPWSE